MLNDAQLRELLKQLSQTAELLGYAITPTAAAVMGRDLAGFPKPMLDLALARVRAEHTGRLTPKVIIERLESLAGRLTPNEAWATVLQAQDERATLVWNSEMQEAWAIASPVAAGGDKIGARMSFLAAYERITSLARATNRLPQPLVSFGTDRELRALALRNAWERGQLPAPTAVVLALENGVTLPEAVFNGATLAQAVEQGLLSADEAQNHLTHGRLALAPPAINPVALLAGKVVPTRDAAPDVRQRLAALRDEAARRTNRFTRAQVQARAERMRLGQAKRRSAAAVAGYLQEGRA